MKRRTKKIIIILGSCLLAFLVIALILWFTHCGTIRELYHIYLSENTIANIGIHGDFAGEDLEEYTLRPECFDEALECLLSLELRPAIFSSRAFGDYDMGLYGPNNSMHLRFVNDSTVAITEGGSNVTPHWGKVHYYYLDEPFDMEQFIRYFEIS